MREQQNLIAQQAYQIECLMRFAKEMNAKESDTLCTQLLDYMNLEQSFNSYNDCKTDTFDGPPNVKREVIN
jgi:hypothetical protein